MTPPLRDLSATDPAKQWLWYLSIAAMLAGVVWLSAGLNWNAVYESAPFLFKGLLTSWALALTAIAIGMVAGSVLAAARLYGPIVIKQVAVVFIEIVRGIPQLMILFWVFFTYPALTGQNLSAWPAAIISLSIIAAAYLAEIIRAGLTSVPNIQTESAYVTGMSRRQTFLYVVLPQALRNMVPALIAQYISIFKTTSIVYVIGLIDFFRAVILVNSREFAPYPLYLTMAATYFVCCYILQQIVRKLDPKYDLTTV